MKQILVSIVFAGVLISCNNIEKNKSSNQEASVNEMKKDTTASTIKKDLATIDNDEALIATALMAAPETSRSGCKVIGYNMAGDFVTLRKGNNEFIVLADNPKKPGFSAACYHKSLEPFMARGRALRAEGKTGVEIFDIREEEAKSGKLVMGKPGATLHIYYGPDEMYDVNTSKVENAHYRYVVYLPFATAQSTGLPEKPNFPNHPWIMNPGTHKAHIMITPSQVNE